MSKFIKFGQVLNIIKMHLYVSLVASFLGTMMISFVVGGTTKYIFSLIFILVYMLVLYSKSEDIARHDKKSYTHDVPYPWKGVLLPVGIFLIWGFLYLLYYITWKYGIISYSSGFINNIIFVIWNFIYTGFMSLGDGKFNYLSLILIFGVPIFACGAGYFAGYKNFDISEKVAKIVYENKKDGEKNDRKDD